MRCLLLPCETRVREFDAKLLLGCLAAARGLTAIVGSKKVLDLNLTRYPPGVYVGKSVTARSRHNLQLARACGHRVALWDEEGLVWASREVYWRTKVDGETLVAPELLIAWGEENAAVWREHPDYRDTPIAVAGNPRTDLLRPEFSGFFSAESARLSDRFGPFILINTNFSRVNHLQPGQNRHLKWLREQRPDDPRGGFAAHKFQLFRAFQEMVPRLAAALPDVTFVVRPHPSERQATWAGLASDLPNVHVDARGNVIPWLLAARGLIHNGCTTAVESFVMGRPAIAYMPVKSDRFDHPLPNGLSLQVGTTPELIEGTAAIFRDPETTFSRQADTRRRNLAERNLTGARGVLASERILDALAPLLQNPAPPSGHSPRLAAATLAARRAWRVLESRVPGHGNHRAYLDHMFPATTLEEVADRLGRFRQCLPRIPEIRVSMRQPNVYLLRPG